jgi:hypothetical protein
VYDVLAEIVVLLAPRTSEPHSLVEAEGATVVGLRPQLERAKATLLGFRDQATHQQLSEALTPPVRMHEDHRDVTEAGHRWAGAVVLEGLHAQCHPDEPSTVVGNDEEAVALGEVPAHALVLAHGQRLTAPTCGLRLTPSGDRSIGVFGPPRSN